MAHPHQTRVPGRLAWLPLLAAVQWLAACGTAPQPVAAGCAPVAKADAAPATGSAEIPLDPGPLQPSAAPWPVHFTDRALQQQVQVQATFAGRDPSGQAMVSARLINCSAQDLTLRARVAFIADNGAPAEAPSAWQPVHLPAHASAVYGERSISAGQARQYLIELGWGS